MIYLMLQFNKKTNYSETTIILKIGNFLYA